MDKEAQEKIATQIDQLIYMGANGKEIVSVLSELGYYKLPKEKPLLLEVHNCHEIDNPFDYNMGAQAQWDICVKHYERT